MKEYFQQIFFPLKEKILLKIAPIEGKILFGGGFAAAKKIGMKAGPLFEQKPNLVAPTKDCCLKFWNCNFGIASLKKHFQLPAKTVENKKFSRVELSQDHHN